MSLQLASTITTEVRATSEEMEMLQQLVGNFKEQGWEKAW
jgi:hypothetical protein